VYFLSTFSLKMGKGNDRASAERWGIQLDLDLTWINVTRGSVWDLNTDRWVIIIRRMIGH